MNLWIRSQDKEDLVECKNIGLAYLGKYGFVDKIGDIERKKFYICEFTDTTHTTLGKYETKERALEVLDEIQNTILGIISSEDIEEQNVKKYTGISTLSNITHCLLYEMPKE